MSQPRQIVRGSTYLITRRALRRHYLLRPEYLVNNLFIFFLAVLGAKYGIAINAFCVLSTHEHLIVTDTMGKLPNFLRDLHRLTALVLKVFRKWEGPIWDHEQTSVVHLQTPEAIVEKLAYVMANPTAVGAVRDAKDWPVPTASSPRRFTPKKNDEEHAEGLVRAQIDSIPQESRYPFPFQQLGRPNQVREEQLKHGSAGRSEANSNLKIE